MPQHIQADIEALCRRFRRRQIEGSLNTARATAELLRSLITRKGHPDANALLSDVRTWGTKLQAAKPLELAVGNIVRRVLHMIREESQNEEKEEVATAKVAALSEKEKITGLLSRAFRQPPPRSASLHNLLDLQHDDNDPAVEDGPAEQETAATPSQQAVDSQDVAQSGAQRRRAATWEGKASIIDQLNELVAELRDIDSNIALHAVEHIHANESILTFGMSDTVLAFLLEAAKKRDFQVVVAEGAPRYGGHELARQLAQAGLHTTAIPDAAIFAMMARVNKVLVGAHALLANGGVMTGVGSHLVALAAKRHAVPFVVLVGLHKLSPLFPHDPSITFNDFKSPSDVMDFSMVAEVLDAEAGSADVSGEQLYVHAPNPVFDYVPPELISLFVTDTGGYTPSYVYRLLAEYYSREDYTLSKELLDTIIR
ncbi:probable translation initiation factor eIF-2B subunit beta [Coccomyxa sp. Obi]|nr:probable translation initiation factor eIF-2B subunit beta [Coccomyxa sp. Obi]